MIELLLYTFMQKALIGGIAIAIACGLIGPFLVLRKLSLLGDGLAHLSFGGVAFGLLIGINPIISALVAVTGGSLFINKVLKKNLHGDAAIALILSFGVGLGVLIIGAVRGFGTDLFSYLIGSILALDSTDLTLAILLLFLSVIFITTFYKQLMLFSFNQDLAQLRMRNAELLNTLFILLVAFAAVVSIRAVGILLVSALIVLPTLIALQVSKSLRTTLFYSVGFSLLATLGGIIGSFYLNLPPSGAIVMLLFALYVLVLVIKSGVIQFNIIHVRKSP